MLTPHDYGRDAIFHPETRALMDRITFDHGGPEYDEKYPDGIPTSVIVSTIDGEEYDSGLVMYPAGHARNTSVDLESLLHAKWRKLAASAVEEPQRIIDRFHSLPTLGANQVASLYDFDIHQHGSFE